MCNMHASWKKERVRIAKVFTYVGLDHLGSTQVNEGNSVVKMWVCLFNCLVVHAIHLELVRGLSAQFFGLFKVFYRKKK